MFQISSAFVGSLSIVLSWLIVLSNLATSESITVRKFGSSFPLTFADFLQWRDRACKWLMVQLYPIVFDAIPMIFLTRTALQIIESICLFIYYCYCLHALSVLFPLHTHSSIHFYVCILLLWIIHTRHKHTYIRTYYTRTHTLIYYINMYVPIINNRIRTFWYDWLYRLTP